MSEALIFAAGCLFGGIASVSIGSKWIIRELRKAKEAYDRANEIMGQGERTNDKT